jgi:hypothetical protein
MIIKALTFARTHKWPLRRSALTYCDDEKPSRVDFAKERYGGPFTTKQVEDVKVATLKDSWTISTLGPFFVMDVPFSFMGFPIALVHTQAFLRTLDTHYGLAYFFISLGLCPY